MKLDFSRFLHNILSHSGLTGVSRWDKLANWFDLDYRVKPDGGRKGKNASLKPDGDTLCVGRSMVEMLGVLAIIGVLSVGAIAGYSKAMMKYKLNRHAETVNLLINNILQLIPTLPLEKNGKIEYYNEIFKKLGQLPDGIKYLNSKSIEDNYFHVPAQIYAVYNPFRYGGIAFYFEKQTNSVSDICRNIVFAAKENADNLWMLETEYRNSTSYNYNGNIYGNKYCNNTTYKCISKITLKDTEKLCSDCADDRCTLFVFWRE